MIESIVKMEKPPQIIFSDGETGIRNSGLFQKYFAKHTITVLETRGHLAFAERLLGTFKSMLDTRIKPGQQWTELIYPMLLTYSNKLAYSATEMAPK